MKLKYFYKIDHKKEPILGSNIRRKSKPGNQWVEIIPICCTPDSTECSCGWRYFIQVDSRNNPVDGSLIKRKSWPKMAENINYQEIQAPDCCALLNYQFSLANDGSVGNITIYVDNVVYVDRDLVAGDSVVGNFRPSKSNSIIRVVVTNTGAGDPSTVLNITGGEIHTETNINIDYSFTFSNKNTSVAINLTNS